MRFVRFIMTGPPTIDTGTFVRMVDEDDNPVTVGFWRHNGHEWEYVMPVRMVPELVVPDAEVAEPQTVRTISRTPPLVDNVPGGLKMAPLSDAQRRRRELKERIASAPKKEATVPVATDPSTAAAAAPQPGWEKCPSCGEPFNPQTDELLDCGACGEAKCTARCMPNPVEPCEDCKALVPDKGEGYSAPPSQAVFGGKQINDPETLKRLGGAGEVDGDDSDDGEGTE